ncbi:MAG: diguanylate cyclase domain-containing protein [Pseudomonadota bacterium]
MSGEAAQNEYHAVSEYRSMRRRLFAFAVGGVALVVVSVQFAAHLLSQSLVEDGYARLQGQLEKSYRRDVRAELSHMATHLRMMLHNPELIEAIRRGDREQMMRELYGQYERQREANPYIQVLHLHDPDNVTLLRLHRPAQYGDDLTRLRPMIADTNTQRRPRYGLEIGKNATNYRVALPISDAGEHLGVVEMGVDAAYFTQRLAAVYGGEVGLFFARAAMHPYLAEHGEEALVGIGEQRLAFSSISPLLRTAGERLAQCAEAFTPFEYDGRSYVAHRIFGLKNYREERVGDVVVVADVNEQAARIRTYTLWSSSAWVLLLLLFIFGQYRMFGRMQRSINSLAFYDPLTRLPNRRLLLDRMRQSLLSCRRGQQHMGLLFIDLDNFKQLNDRHGHHHGDELLKQVAERLRGCVRSNDSVGRQGGDEFVIVLEGLGESDDLAEARARQVADKVVELLSRPYTLTSELEWECSASVGIAVCDDSLVDLDELMRRADVAMYRAKAAGRNRVVSYTDGP